MGDARLASVLHCILCNIGNAGLLKSACAGLTILFSMFLKASLANYRVLRV
jgi:hypothetical protein